MKILCDRTALCEALSPILPAIPTKEPPKPACKNLHMEAEGERLILEGTNLELAITSQIDSVKVESPGEVLVPARPFYSLLTEINDPTLELVLEDGNLLVPTGSGEYRIVVSDADFPEITFESEAKGIEIPVEILNRLFQSTEYACAKEASRYAMNGVLLRIREGKLTFVGTDGRRLAMASESLPEVPETLGAEALLPHTCLGSALRSITSLGGESATLFFGESYVCFSSGRTKVSVQMIRGTFPDFDSVIPQDMSNKVEIQKSLLESALRRVSVFCEDMDPAVRIEFDGTRAVFSSESSEVGSGNASVDVELSGGGGKIVFNPRFILDAVKTCHQDQVHFEFEDGNSPGKFLLGEQYVYVLMPITGKT